MKGVQCYELFGGIALKIHTFSFSFFIFINPTGCVTKLFLLPEKLSVSADAVQQAVEGLMYLLCECGKLMVSHILFNDVPYVLFKARPSL